MLEAVWIEQAHQLCVALLLPRLKFGKCLRIGGIDADDAGAIKAHATGVSDRILTDCVVVAAGGKDAGAAGRAGSFSISLDPGK